MPTTIDRLNAEVRALQIHLRRQREATKAAEKRAVEAEVRLVEKRDHKVTNRRGSSAVSGATDASASAQNEVGEQAIADEALKNDLKEEKQRVKVSVAL